MNVVIITANTRPQQRVPGQNLNKISHVDLYLLCFTSEQERDRNGIYVSLKMELV